MNTVKVGAVTIGQSPRSDVVPDLSRQLGPNVEIVQRGALDDLHHDEVRELAPASESAVLVSRLRDGREAEVDKDFVERRLQDAIGELEPNVSLILLLCTAPFDSLEATVPLLRPAKLLERAVSATRVRRLGVLTPSSRQLQTQRRRWEPFATDRVVVASASPYSNARDFEEAVREFTRNEAEFIVLDCIGYTDVMKAQVQSMMPVPVVSALDELGRAAARELKTES